MNDLARSFLSYRHLLISLAWRDITSAYSGSVVGSLWAVVDPLVYVTLTVVFFQFAIRGGDTGGVPYVAWVLPGIIFWTFLSSVIAGSVNSIREYSYLLRHRAFDMRLVALVKLLSALFVHLVLFAALIAIIGGLGYIPIGWKTLSILYYIAAAFVMLIGFSWPLSAMGVFWKDTRNLVAISMQVAFWVSPIFWEPDRFPRPVALIMYLNPFYYVIHGFRAAILSQEFGSNFWTVTLYFWCLTAALLWWGSRLFVRLSKSFGDVV